MQDAASIRERLLRAALRRRASLWLAVLLPWLLLLSPVGLAVALAWIGWDYDRLRARVRSRWPGWLDQSLAWLEDSSALLQQATGAIARMQRERILRRLQADLRDDVIDSIVRERVRFDWRVLAASAAPALALFAWWQLSGEPVTARAVLARLAPQTSDVVVRVTPPRYTGAAPFESAPRDLTAPQYSVVAWCRRPGQETSGAIELSDGRRLAVGPACVQVRLGGALAWRWRGRRYQLAVRPDRPPEASVSAPRDLDGAQPVLISVRVRDDFRVRRASLHLTLARPAGGELQFIEREVALPESRDPRLLTWSKHWSLAELGMQPGDELYIHARASDNAEVAQSASSPTLALRLPQAEDDSSLALQRRVVAGIEQLRAELAAGSVTEEARLSRIDSLAGAQEALRERYAVYLDEEGDSAPIDAGVRPAVRRAAAHMIAAAEELRAGALDSAQGSSQRAWTAVAALAQAERMHLYPRHKAVLDGGLDAAGAASHQRAQGSASAGQPALRVPARIDTPFARAWGAP